MTYLEAYEAAEQGKRVKLVLPAKVRGESHVFVMKAISTGDVMMHIYIENRFAPSIEVCAMAVNIANPIHTNSSIISEDDLEKWEVIE